jgi:hypothetical protein
VSKELHTAKAALLIALPKEHHHTVINVIDRVSDEAQKPVTYAEKLLRAQNQSVKGIL